MARLLSLRIDFFDIPPDRAIFHLTAPKRWQEIYPSAASSMIWICDRPAPRLR
jgi:hypothetical protein